MDGYVLKRAADAFSLWEVSLGVVLIALVAGTVVVSSGKMTEYARGQRTLEDMAAILHACRQYDALNGGWPSSLSALHAVLPQAELNNVWGYPFVVSAGADRVWVETDVPVGAVSRSLKGAHVVVQEAPGKDHVRLSTSRIEGGSARLVYEKRNVYVP
jgi:type II secretory pathway pseudopilin PulG